MRGKVDFLQIRNFSIAEIGKATSESWEKWGSYCTAKAYSCNRWTAMWFASDPKMTGRTKKPYFDPCKTSVTSIEDKMWFGINSFCWIYILIIKMQFTHRIRKSWVPKLITPCIKKVSPILDQYSISIPTFGYLTFSEGIEKEHWALKWVKIFQKFFCHCGLCPTKSW